VLRDDILRDDTLVILLSIETCIFVFPGVAKLFVTTVAFSFFTVLPVVGCCAYVFSSCCFFRMEWKWGGNADLEQLQDRDLRSVIETFLGRSEQPELQKEWRQDLQQLQRSVTSVVDNIIRQPDTFFKRVQQLIDSRFWILLLDQQTAGDVQAAIATRPQWVKDDGVCVIVNQNKDVRASYLSILHALLALPECGGVIVPYQRRTMDANKKLGWITDPTPAKATLQDLLARAGKVQAIMDNAARRLRDMSNTHFQQQPPSEAMIISALAYCLRDSGQPYCFTYAHDLDPLDSGPVGTWLQRALHCGLCLPGACSLGSHADVAADLVQHEQGSSFYITGLPSSFSQVSGACTVARALLDVVHQRELSEPGGVVDIHSGINSSVLIVSEACTLTPWHHEDGRLGAANVNFGAPKTWEILLLPASNQFSKLVHDNMMWRTKSTFKRAAEASIYKEEGRTAVLVLQHAGQEVITFAGPIWHQTESTGPGLAEACNTAIGIEDDEEAYHLGVKPDWDLAYQQQQSRNDAIKSWADSVLKPAASFFPYQYALWLCAKRYVS
jgi:hypothetical protein